MIIQATYIDLNLFNPRSLLQAEQGSVFSFHPSKLNHLSICQYYSGQSFWSTCDISKDIKST